jgi:hypothetical protein
MIHSHHHKKNRTSNHHDHKADQHTVRGKILEGVKNYTPLITIFIFCILIPAAHIDSFDPSKFMDYFMGYFFIFLSMFKFFDIKGFVDGFATYDLITQRLRAYGYLYPFIELGLGLSYIAQYNLFVTHVVTVFLMLISGVGVIKSIFSGQNLKCACLGTTLNVPLSTVSVIENLGMGAMAAYKLFF